MWNAIKNSSFFQTFETLIKKEPSLVLEKLWDAPKAVLALSFAQVTQKNVLIITGGERETRLLEDLKFFAEETVLSFPAWETLPGEEISPSPDIIGKRFEILHRLSNHQGPHILLAYL